VLALEKPAVHGSPHSLFTLASNCDSQDLNFPSSEYHSQEPLMPSWVESFFNARIYAEKAESVTSRQS
jgi:hypothetical protein